MTSSALPAPGVVEVPYCSSAASLWLFCGLTTDPQVAAAGNRLWWRNDTLHTSLLAMGCAAGYFPGLGDACMQVSAASSMS